MSSAAASRLPAALADRVWPAQSWVRAGAPVRSSGHPALDAELPGGGWPCGALTELLQPQPGWLEWRLLGPVCRAVAAEGRPVLLIGPPQVPHLPGLGLPPEALVWVQARTPAERLWCTEQLLRSGAAALLLVWLPQARPEQLRRLQVAAEAGEALVFACRPLTARMLSSPAPLRLQARLDLDWAVRLQIFKRRGPLHEGELVLPSVPATLAPALPARLEQPARWRAGRVAVPSRLPEERHALMPTEPAAAGLVGRALAALAPAGR